MTCVCGPRLNVIMYSDALYCQLDHKVPTKRALVCHSLFSSIIQKPIEKSYWVFVEGTRVMITSRLAYKNALAYHCSTLLWGLVDSDISPLRFWCRLTSYEMFWIGCWSSLQVVLLFNPSTKPVLTKDTSFFLIELVKCLKVSVLNSFPARSCQPAPVFL